LIDENRREHLNNSQSTLTPSNIDVRYYADEPSIDKALIKSFKPGVLSQDLKKALGMKSEDEPPFYSSMRIHGYPPAYIASELEMDDPFAKEANEPTTKSLYPGLNILPQRSPITPRRSAATSPQYSPYTPNGNTTPALNNTNSNSFQHSTPNSNSKNLNPTISLVTTQAFSPYQSPVPFMMYAATNETQRFPQQQVSTSPYKPPASTQTTKETDITELDMDMT